MSTIQPTALNILLADDDSDDRFFFEKALKQIAVRHNLNTVTDGEQLMNYLTKKQGQIPDVLFLDLNMPRKNGHECLVEIKRNKDLKQIPIIIYSTSLQDEHADILYANGAHYYLHKSDFDELPKWIEMALNLLAENPAQPLRAKFILNLQEV